MQGRRPTSEERHWLDLCAQVPCIVCAHFHNTHDTPAEIHHIAGARAEGAHLLTLSLCPNHHRVKDNQKPPRWISRHGDGRAAFEGRYVTEAKLLKIQMGMVASLEQNAVLKSRVYTQASQTPRA